MSDPHPHMIISRDIFVSGSQVGYITATYSQLLAVLGRPNKAASDKTTCEWSFRCQDGTEVAVYDWKERATPMGRYDWHVGGSSPAALDALRRATGGQFPIRSLY